MAGILQGCLVLSVNVNMWGGRRFDKKNTAKIIADTNAMSDALRVNKHLVPKDTLAPIQSAAGAIRIHFYKATLPWKDNGDRLIPRPAYMEFIPKHQELVRAFQEQVDAFLNEGYPKALEQAEFRMGGAFDPNDYPKPHALAQMFRVNLDVTAVPADKDWRLHDDPTILQGRIDRAMAGLWEKINEHLESIVNGIESGGLKKASINNLKAFVDTIPKLNFTHSEELANIGKQIEERIARFDADDLIGKSKGIEDNRNLVQQEAQNILDAMKGFLRASQPEEVAA